MKISQEERDIHEMNLFELGKRLGREEAIKGILEALGVYDLIDKAIERRLSDGD